MSTPKDVVTKASKRKCPGSFANLGRTSITKNRNAPSLRRWKATWDALSSRLDGGQGQVPPAEPFDPVQREIVAAQINRVKPLLPAISESGEFDFEWPRLSYPIGDDELEVFFQFVHSDSDGILKMYRLKTGQIKEDSEFASAPEEIAAVVSDPRFPDSLEAYEIRAADGEMIRLEMPRRKARQVLAKLESDYRSMVNADPHEMYAGLHCSMCEVADLCKTFPAVDPTAQEIAPSSRPRLPSAHRLMISKSRMEEMDLCERRAAWRSWFVIPADPDHRFTDASPGLAVGNRFHSQMAKALLSGDPEAFFRGDPETKALYDQHRKLPCTEGIRITATEFPLGFTVRYRTDQRSVSVVPYGLADAVGRERDGTPAVIDHKTGRLKGMNPREAEIYALGALLRIEDAPAVAVHIHWLSTLGEEPVCRRTVWERARIGEWASSLMRLVKAAAGWDLSDATSPPYRVGEWCATCPFEQRCLSHR